MEAADLLEKTEIAAILGLLSCDEPSRAELLIRALGRFLWRYSTEDGVNGNEPLCMYQDSKALDDIVTDWLDGEGKCLVEREKAREQSDLPYIGDDYDL